MGVMDVERFLPLKPVDFLVLLVLERRDRHGYGIVQDVKAETGGSVRLVPGNLYAVLHRLMVNGLLEEAPRQSDPKHRIQRCQRNDEDRIQRLKPGRRKLEEPEITNRETFGK